MTKKLPVEITLSIDKEDVVDGVHRQSVNQSTFACNAAYVALVTDLAGARSVALVSTDNLLAEEAFAVLAAITACTYLKRDALTKIHREAIEKIYEILPANLVEREGLPSSKSSISEFN